MRLNGPLKWGSGRLFALVFLVSFAARILLDVLFQARFGLHATNHIETWFYASVMEGLKETPYQASDPTVWILRAASPLFPGPLAFFGVILSSAVLSSLTAAAIFLLVGQMHDKRAGLLAGLVYGGMVEPLGLSMSGFTHDHLQLLLMVASMLFAAKAIRSGLAGGFLWSLAYVVTVEAAKHVNDSINMIVGVTLAYVGYAVIEYARRQAFGAAGEGLVYPAYASGAIVVLFAFGSTLLPPLLEGSLESLPQGRMGSADILPAGLNTIWLRYNLLLFLLPYGIVAACRRRDMLGILLATVGFMAASVMDRGTRIGDIGVAMLAAFAIADWDAKAKNLVPEWLRAGRLSLAASAVGITCLAWLASAYASHASADPAAGYLVTALAAAAAWLAYSQCKPPAPSRRPKAGIPAGLLPKALASAALAAAAAAAALATEWGAGYAGKVWQLGVFFAGVVAPASAGLFASAALPALLSALATGWAAKRYVAAGWWNTGRVAHAAILFYMLLAAVSSAALTRAAGHGTPSLPNTLLYFACGACLLYTAFTQMRLYAALALFLAGFAAVSFNGTIHPAYSALFAAGAAALFAVLRGWPSDTKALAAAAVLIVLGLATNAAYVGTAESRKVTTDAEYGLMSWLRDNNAGGRILVAWDHGYMAEAVTGLESVSTPNMIDQRVHDMLWMPERQASLNLRNSGVRYILFNEENFNVARDAEGELSYRIMGAFVMTPERVPPPELSDRYLVYLLRHNMTGGGFRPLRSVRDDATGMTISLYEVVGEAEPGGAAYAGGIAYNPGGNKTVRMLAATTLSDNGTYARTYHTLANETFGAGELKEVLYRVRGLNLSGCVLRTSPLAGGGWDFGGTVAYANAGKGGEFPVRAALVTRRGGDLVGDWGKAVRIPAGGRARVGYEFPGVDEFGEYAVELSSPPGLTVLGNETTAPALDDVRLLAAFC
jgi:hypothetical protein